jgi:hypothetical protein
MTEPTTELITIFRSIVAALGKLSDQEIADLMAERKIISLTLVDKPVKRARTHDDAKVDVKQCVDKLNQMQSREEGTQYLESLNLRKNELNAIASEAKAYVSGKEKIEEIIEKIINSTIGYRLKSQAIQGFDRSKQ